MSASVMVVKDIITLSERAAHLILSKLGAIEAW